MESKILVLSQKRLINRTETRPYFTVLHKASYLSGHGLNVNKWPLEFLKMRNCA